MADKTIIPYHHDDTADLVYYEMDINNQDQALLSVLAHETVSPNMPGAQIRIKTHLNYSMSKCGHVRLFGLV